jgi:hypothetical protein
VVIEGKIQAVSEHTVTIDGEVYTLAGGVAPSAFIVGERVALTVVLGEETATVVESGPATGAEDDNLHPVGAAIADAAGVPYEEVMGLKETTHLGFGELARAYLVAAETGLTASEIIALRAAGARWDEILRANDVPETTFSNGRIMSAHGTGAGIPSPSQEEHPGRGQGDGQGGSQGGGQGGGQGSGQSGSQGGQGGGPPDTPPGQEKKE